MERQNCLTKLGDPFVCLVFSSQSKPHVRILSKSVQKQLLNISATFVFLSRFFFPVNAPGRCSMFAYLPLKKGVMSGLVMSSAYCHDRNWAQVCLMLLMGCCFINPTLCRQENIGGIQSHSLFTMQCFLFTYLYLFECLKSEREFYTLYQAVMLQTMEQKKENYRHATLHLSLLMQHDHTRQSKLFSVYQRFRVYILTHCRFGQI